MNFKRVVTVHIMIVVADMYERWMHGDDETARESREGSLLASLADRGTSCDWVEISYKLT